MNEMVVSAERSSELLLEPVRAFVDRMFPRPRAFAVRLWNGMVLAADDQARFTLVLHSPAGVRRMFSPPLELSFAEAFIRGDIDIEGDLLAGLDLLDVLQSRRWTPGRLLDLSLHWWLLPDGADGAGALARAPARLAGAPHSRERDRAAIRYHYDVGNEFYAQWLDKRMVYSCACFQTGNEDIDAAQEAKLELICRKLRLKAGDRLLDIGCGWGGLVMYAAERFGVRALGITLSDQQYLLANQRIAEAGLSERVEVRMMDYRDSLEGTFDKIVSVGMAEHVGRRQMPRYFAQAFQALRPGGLFLNHCISVHPPAPDSAATLSSRLTQRFLLGSGQFIDRYIFPDGELLPVSELGMMAELAGFEVRDVENLREHYVLTLRRWISRLEANRTPAIRAAGEATWRTWRLYMAGAARRFQQGIINVNQALLLKPSRDGRGGVPLSRADLYA